MIVDNKVSIIIPTYNRSKYLEKTIKSALRQTYKNTEIIVVDDGSTDDTDKVLSKYKNEIKIITKTNGGTASALNVGIQSMTGEWFRWIGDDDYLYENAIEIMIDETKKFQEESKTIIFYSNYEYVDSNDNILGEKIEPNYNSLTDFEKNVILLDHCYANINTALIHKSVFEKCGEFTLRFNLVIDYELFLRCCLVYNYKLYLVPTVTISYRKHQTQLSLKHKTILEEGRTVKNEVLEKIPSLKNEYLKHLKKYKNTNNPKHIIFRRKIRDFVFFILPDNIKNKFVKWYLRRRGITKFYDVYLKDDHPN